jgi:hypothetical protein
MDGRKRVSSGLEYLIVGGGGGGGGEFFGGGGGGGGGEVVTGSITLSRGTYTITIGNTGKSVNGSANVAWSLAEIGAAKSGAAGAIVENAQTIAANYTLTTGHNGMSAGPITINSGVTVTIPSGASWVVV